MFACFNSRTLVYIFFLFSYHQMKNKIITSLISTPFLLLHQPLQSIFHFTTEARAPFPQISFLTFGKIRFQKKNKNKRCINCFRNQCEFITYPCFFHSLLNSGTFLWCSLQHRWFSILRFMHPERLSIAAFYYCKKYNMQ